MEGNKNGGPLQSLLFWGGGSGAGDVSVIPLTVTDNGVYTAPSGKAYSPVTVAIPEASGVSF